MMIAKLFFSFYIIKVDLLLVHNILFGDRNEELNNLQTKLQTYTPATEEYKQVFLIPQIQVKCILNAKQIRNVG